MLMRSKKAPLDVYFSGISRRNFPYFTLTAILHQIERIRALSFTWMVSENVLETTQAVLARFGREATLLEELTVEMYSGDYPVFALDVFHLTRLLRKLCLTGVRCYWDTLRFPNLTQLTLHGKEASATVSGTQFTDALCRMQHLEDLSMDLSTIPLRQYTPSTNLQLIHLPCLKRLEIMNDDSH
jgi:hypothetical protein